MIKKMLLCAAAVLAVACAHEQDSDFRMMIRLWPEFSDNPEQTDALIDAFRKYDFCDEVWLKAQTPFTHSLAWHEEHAAKMALAADKMREAGIIPSMQEVVLGHGDGMTVFDVMKDSTIHWGTMVGPDGRRTGSVNCPRQKAYLDHIEKSIAIYAEKVKPRSIYLDDDMRLTHHTPATMGCYCDDCIALFNAEHGYSYGRESLVQALLDNEGQGRLRKEWIGFGQESLAGVAAAIARGAHRVSPETRIGLQHASFHRKLMEGHDWNPMFRAMMAESGHAPLSRPGNGFYDDHSPRGMLKKGLDISRQIRRLIPEITEISPEIEGYVHKASGKSPRGIALETMYYLAMGGTQMSYAIICGAREPISWYADNYFKALADVKPFAKEYADFNAGSLPAGIDPYMNPGLVGRDVDAGEDRWAWANTTAGNAAFDLAPFGLPFAPEDPASPVLMLDKEAVRCMPTEELSELLRKHSAVVDEAGFQRLEKHGLLEGYTAAESPKGDPGDYDSPFIADGGRYSEHLARFRFLEKDGLRLACAPSFEVNLKKGCDFNGAYCLLLSRTFDWASGGKLPAVMESFAQAAIVPRCDKEGTLRSVAILNCSISPLDGCTLRIRPGGDSGMRHRLVLKRKGHRDRTLKTVRDGDDLIVSVPGLDAWEFAWIAAIR